MGAASYLSEPILFSVTAPRLWPFFVLLASLVVCGWALRLLLGPRLPKLGAARPLRWFLWLAVAFLGASALWAALQLASPEVRLKATERGLTSYMTGAFPGRGVRLQMARHADGDGLFIPWQAVTSFALERVECATGAGAVPCDVLVIGLRPGFEGLAAQGVVVAPGVRRSTLDLPVPTPPGGPALLAQLLSLQQRFSGR
jgi:hypothetical protein